MKLKSIYQLRKEIKEVEAMKINFIVSINELKSQILSEEVNKASVQRM